MFRRLQLSDKGTSSINILYTFIRYFLGTYLVLSAILKAVSFNYTIGVIHSYLPINLLFLQFIIIIIILLELILGVLMLSPYINSMTFCSLSILFAAFLGISFARVILSIQGDCGCTGAVKVFSSSGLSLLRDIVFFLSALLLLWYACSYKAVINTVKVMILVMLLSNLFVAYIYFNKYKDIIDVNIEEHLPLHWHGVLASKVNNNDIEDIMNACFSGDVIYQHVSAGIPYYRIISSPNGVDKVSGWIVMMVIPVPNVNYDYYKMAIVLNSDLSVSSILLEKPINRNASIWPTNNQVEHLVGELANNNLFMNKYISNSNESLFNIYVSIINAYNNALKNIMICEYQYVVWGNSNE